MNTTKLRALLEASTPGPWVPYQDHDYYQCGTYYGARPYKWNHNAPPGEGRQVDCDLSDADGLRQYVFRLEGSEADAQLIVAMRNCAEELLAVVEASQAVYENQTTGIGPGTCGLADAEMSVLEDALVALNTKLGESK